MASQSVITSPAPDVPPTPSGAATQVGPQPPTSALLAQLDVEDREILANLLVDATPAMDEPRLHERGACKRIFGVTAKRVSDTPARFPRPVPITESRTGPTGKMPTLSTEQEQTMFLRLNYTRWKIMTILESYTGKHLTLEAARKLIAWGTWEREVRSRIVEINLPLVLAMAKRTRLASIDFNEMISEGNMALLRSVDKFDCGRGFKFSTYSCRAILKSFSRVAMRASRYRGTFPVEYNPAIERSDHIEKKRIDHEADCVGELKTILTRNVAELTEVERTVIAERFALDRLREEPPSPKTLEQVGKIIGVTKERVRQIQNKALSKIRNALEETYLAA